jgi:hypothetical protein
LALETGPEPELRLMALDAVGTGQDWDRAREREAAAGRPMFTGKSTAIFG